ncbi:Aste57867_2570 [Aphanomyces stellatus]|uniref:Aste57867_2570 protein n=1 Tax=Aphanomyces stellatus TaxID=120398 RepID=A0A485K7W8_9STRA|nr:hypothetical protein As57867_002563 [Aphanomyces stellatus]VFT79766.1 Aste57867_2570 [Aphanomyces stellatus]
MPSPSGPDLPPRQRSRSHATVGDKDVGPKRYPSNSGAVLSQHLEPLENPPKSGLTGSQSTVLNHDLDALDKFNSRTSPPKHKLEKLDAPKSPAKLDVKALPTLATRNNCLQAIAPTPSLLEHARPPSVDSADAKASSSSSSYPLVPKEEGGATDDSKCVEDPT